MIRGGGGGGGGGGTKLLVLTSFIVHYVKWELKESILPCVKNETAGTYRLHCTSQHFKQYHICVNMKLQCVQ